MSRFKRFAHSLASGYVLLGANIAYTLASIPLALKYLSNAEFGLWALATKIGGFIALLDFGLSAAVARILVDHKDDRASGSYGSLIKTGFLVGVAQGVLVLLVGTVLAYFIGPMLHIPVALQNSLKWLMIGQYGMLAISFSMRTLSHILTAHQRYDITNYAQTLLLPLAFGVVWYCFAHGQGVFSILWGQALTTVLLVAANWAGCIRLKLFPNRGQWGKPTWAEFKGVFAFGSDIFIFTLGGQLINASQTILLTRLLGIETVAVWNVCTRVYEVLVQVIFRIFDYSSSALAEMIVRGEKKLLAMRFRQIVVLSTSLSIAAGAIFAVSNTPFIKIWTRNRFDSPVLLAGDIKDARLVAARILEKRDPSAQFLWREFSPQSREQIAALISNEEALPELQRVLATNIDVVLERRVLAQEMAFSHLQKSNVEQSTTGNSKDNMATQWSNRHLLEAAFPQEIANSRIARWSKWNDLLLAIWLVACVSLHAHTGLVGQTKQFRGMRYIFLFEGLAFISLTILLHHFGGMTMMLGASIVCSLAFSFSYGLYRTRQYFGLSRTELWSWHRAPLKLASWLLPVSVLVALLTHTLPPFAQLGINASIVSACAVFGTLRFGLDAAFKEELLRRAPASWHRMLIPIIGIQRSSGDSGSQISK